MQITDVRLENDGYAAELSSRFGGNCYRLFHKETGAEILRSPKDERELRSDIYLYGNPILFPPNRIRDGSFEFEGRAYSFPVNEPSRRCHIHGALYEQPFLIEEKTQNSVVFVYRAGKGEYLGFPHAFTVKRKYSLEKDGLHERVEATNDSAENMPFMLAFHTTLNVPFLPEKGDDYRLFLPVGREQVRDERLLPTKEYVGGRERENALSKGTFKLLETPVSALYESAGERAEISCLTNGRKIVYEAEEKYAYRMLWRCDGANFVALEPQTCAIDCFHLEAPATERGLIVIAPRETVRLHTRLALE